MRGLKPLSDAAVRFDGAGVAVTRVPAPFLLQLGALIAIPAQTRLELPLVRDLERAVGEQGGLLDLVAIVGLEQHAGGTAGLDVDRILAEFVPDRIEFAVEGAAHPVQAVVAAGSEPDFLAELVRRVGLGEGRIDVGEHAVRDGCRLGGILGLALQAIPVRGGAGQVGEAQIRHRGEAVDVHRVLHGFRNVERLVVREVGGARRRIEIVVAAQDQALVERARGDREVAVGLEQHARAGAVQVFGVDVVDDVLDRRGEDVAPGAAGILREGRDRPPGRSSRCDRCRCRPPGGRACRRMER